MKTKTIMGITLTLFLLGVLSIPVMAQSEQAKLNEKLRQVRLHILKDHRYQHVENALADGYVAPEPFHVPMMGIHYVNTGLASDLVVEELSPEILLYVDTDEGPKLVGVEYFVIYIGQPPPTLFGHPMDGPMPGHGPGQPDHYDLHVWLFEENPDGIFAVFNPNIP